MKAKLTKNQYIKVILLMFVIVLICAIWLTQLRQINSSRFEVYKAGDNYLIFAEFDNTFMVPIKIKGVSIESNNADIPLESEIEEWGIWVDNASLLGAMKLTDKELGDQRRDNVTDYVVTEKVKLTVFFRPLVDSEAITKGNLNQSIIIQYSVLGFPKKVNYQLNR